MRQSLIRSDSSLLTYPIREVVQIGKQIEALDGYSMIWENIGDPVAAGEHIPDWIKDTVHEESTSNAAFCYTESKGRYEARKYIIDNFSDERVCTTEDVILFNGLGEAINKIFINLPKEVRILVPNPTYPSHATAEAMHAGCNYISYELDPNNNWEPDVEQIENKVRFNDQIVGILVINPNNPTSSVYGRETLEKIVAIAKQYNCFLIFDEIYHHMVFEGVKNTLLHEIIGEVPGLSLKGISKDIPWPGSRCGWMEVYNADKDKNFNDFINTIILSKMLEVCSTTLPQLVFPRVYSHPDYSAYLKSRIDKYTRRAEQAYAFFKPLKHVRVNKPQGVFYCVVELLDIPRNTLEVKNKQIRLFLDELETPSLAPDFQFAFELMGAEGVCVVPLTGFGSHLTGFRMTLLQEDDDVFTDTLVRLGRAIEAYYG